jgi:hypothetical protein
MENLEFPELKELEKLEEMHKPEAVEYSPELSKEVNTMKSDIVEGKGTHVGADTRSEINESLNDSKFSTVDDINPNNEEDVFGSTVKTAIKEAKQFLSDFEEEETKTVGKSNVTETAKFEADPVRGGDNYIDTSVEKNVNSNADFKVENTQVTAGDIKTESEHEREVSPLEKALQDTKNLVKKVYG